jgi:hypothetical protein
MCRRCRRFSELCVSGVASFSSVAILFQLHINEIKKVSCSRSLLSLPRSAQSFENCKSVCSSVRAQ